MIKAEVRYTAEHFKAVTTDSISPKIKGNWLAITIACTVLAIFVACTRKAYFNFFAVQSVIMWLVVIAYVLLFVVFFSPKKQMKRYAAANGDTVLLFEFGEESFSVENHSQNSDGSNSFKYDAVTSAEESGGFFRITAKGTGTFAIRETELTDGTPDELRAFLKDKLGDKFRQQ